MAKCALCGRKFFFAKFDSNGYCTDCSIRMQQAKVQLEQQLKQHEENRQSIISWIDSLPTHEIELSDTPCKRQHGYEEFSFSNITPKGKYNGDIVTFDTETTGLSPSKDRIIEIGAIRYLDGEPIEKFHSYVNPERHIPEDATKINHITDEMVCDAPTIGQILPSFDKFIGNSTLIAHNLDFDLKFMYYSGSKVLDTKREYIDTLEQAHKLIKKSEVDDYSLETLCYYFDHDIAQAHSALADAFAVGWLFYNLVLEKQGSVRFMKTPNQKSVLVRLNS